MACEVMVTEPFMKFFFFFFFFFFWTCTRIHPGRETELTAY